MLPKEVKVAGYITEIKDVLPDSKLMKIGCHWYTKDSLLTIRDILRQCTGYREKDEINLFHTKSGKVAFTINEIEEALKLFPK